MANLPTESMEQVIREDGRYVAEAFEYLHSGLARAAKETHGQDAGKPGRSHVTGKQMCIALRDLAVERWGMLAKTVLSRWNINATIDFGNMVYLLIRHDFMHKTEEDSIEDFRDVFDFEDAFGETGFADHFELTE